MLLKRLHSVMYVVYSIRCSLTKQIVQCDDHFSFLYNPQYLFSVSLTAFHHPFQLAFLRNICLAQSYRVT